MFHNYFVFLAMTSTFEKLIFSHDQLLDLDACVSLLTDLQKTQMLDKKFTTEARNGPLLKLEITFPSDRMLRFYLLLFAIML